MVSAHETGVVLAATLTALEVVVRADSRLRCGALALFIVLFAVAVARTTHFIRIPRSSWPAPWGSPDSRVVPVGAVQFHVRSAAALLALLPLAVTTGTARVRTSRTHD